MKASDPRLTEPLSYLPEDKSQLITLSGGLERFLLDSPSFVAHGDLICLTEDAPVVRDSISQSSSATSSSSSLGSHDFTTSVTSTEKSSSRVQVHVSSVVASDVQVGSQTVTKNSHGGRYTPSDSTADSRQPSLGSLIDSHNHQQQQLQQHQQQDTPLSGGLKFDGDATKMNPTKTYGVELGSGLNSPSNSPLDSPRMMSPTDLVNLNMDKNTGNVGGSGGSLTISKQQKLGAMAHSLATKRPDSAGSGGGEKRGRENIPPKDVTVTTSSSSSSSKRQQQNTKTSGGSSRAIGYERQKKREQQLQQQTSRGSGSGRRDSSASTREEGSEKLSSSLSERLLSTASDSGELGVLGEFFGHATASASGGTGSRSGSGSGSASGSQGDESSPAPPSSTTPSTSTSSASAFANSRLFRAAISATTSSTGSGKETSVLEKETTKTKVTSTSVSVETRDVFVQTSRLKTGVKVIQTDPLPSVENFKDRYEKVLKEKKDLQVKLERSEDQKFKMQRDHKREMDKLEKKYYTEAKKVGVALCYHMIIT